MDDLLRDFLTESAENLARLDSEIVELERSPDDPELLKSIFRTIHTIKGTCGFLNLPRLEALTHAAEALMGKFRDGARVTGEAVTLVLATIDRVKVLLDQLEPAAAYVRNRLGDLLAYTGGFERLAKPIGLLDASAPNLVRFALTDPRARAAFPQWEQKRRAAALLFPHLGQRSKGDPPPTFGAAGSWEPMPEAGAWSTDPAE
jgi:two-component system chemotaxis sensor kinase CheA